MTDEKVDNWTLILNEYGDKIDDYFRHNRTETIHKLFGIVNGWDDYYYGMIELYTGNTTLLSCVGSLENWGYTHLPDFIDNRCFQFDCGGECEVIEYSDYFGPDEVYVDGLEKLKCMKCNQTRETKYQFLHRVDKISETIDRQTS